MGIENQNQPSQVRDAMARAQSKRGEESTGGSRREETRRDTDDRRDDSRRDSRDRDDTRRSESRRGAANTATLGQIGRANPTPLAMSNTAEVLEQFRRDFVEAMPAKDDGNLLIANVFPIDAALSGIPFSVVVVAGKLRAKEKLGVGYHAFLLAESAEPLRPREETIRGNRVTIVQVPGDGYDAKTREVIREVLQRHYGADENFFTADAEVIQPGFPTIKEDDQAIADCVKNAFAAIKTAIDRNNPDAVQLCLLAPDDAPKTHNTIHVQHRQNHIFDRGHQPVRADIVIDLLSRDARDRTSRDSIDQLVTGTRVTRTTGYFDFVYAPSEGAVGHNELYGRRSGRSTGEELQLYALRFIQTLCDTIDFSPTTMLLAQASVNAIAESKEIMRAFEPNLLLGEDDPNNIGFLAIETNLQDMERGFGERLKTKSADFTASKRLALLRATVRPGIFHSIDVPECGAATWQYTDLLAAAQGNRKALDRIYDAGCVLTGGHLEDYFSRNDMIIDSHIERVHAGFYWADGSKLDIRDFGYSALMNFLRPEKIEDLEIIQKWGMAASLNDDTLLSQSDRFEIIKSFLPSAEITGYHQRFNITSMWQDALVDAIAACKLSLNPTSSGRDSNDRYRTTYGNMDQLLMRPGSGGLYRNQRSSRDRDDDRYERSGRNDGRY